MKIIKRGQRRALFRLVNFSSNFPSLLWRRRSSFGWRFSCILRSITHTCRPWPTYDPCTCSSSKLAPHLNSPLREITIIYILVNLQSLWLLKRTMLISPGSRVADEEAATVDGRTTVSRHRQHRYARIRTEFTTWNVHGLRRDARQGDKTAQPFVSIGHAPLSFEIGPNHHHVGHEPVDCVRFQRGNATNSHRIVRQLRRWPWESGDRCLCRNPNETNSILFGDAANNGPFQWTSVYHVSLASAICFYRYVISQLEPSSERNGKCWTFLLQVSEQIYFSYWPWACWVGIIGPSPCGWKMHRNEFVPGPRRFVKNGAVCCEVRMRRGQNCRLCQHRTMNRIDRSMMMTRISASSTKRVYWAWTMWMTLKNCRDLAVNWDYGKHQNRLISLAAPATTKNRLVEMYQSWRVCDAQQGQTSLFNELIKIA